MSVVTLPTLKSSFFTKSVAKQVLLPRPHLPLHTTSGTPRKSTGLRWRSISMLDLLLVLLWMMMMRVMMLVMTRPRTPRAPGDLRGTCSIALFPFWRFDAKGGEVVLLGCLSWVCKGRSQASRLFASYKLVPLFVYLNNLV